MCNANCIIFGVNNLNVEEIKGKRIIEVGSRDVNGSMHRVIEKWGPTEYVGVDIEQGRGVDVICGVEQIVDKFGKNSFDVIISNELIEHVRDWRGAISNIKNICKPNGVVLITTRSLGFPYHGYPHDYWRYELEDMKNIFSDFSILTLEKDLRDPGVFVKARKPVNFQENDLSEYKLYCIMSGKKERRIEKQQYMTVHYFKTIFIKKLKKNFIKKLKKYIKLLLFIK